MPDKFVDSTYADGVATITLDRPPQNLMNIAMMEQMNSAVLALRDHHELKVLVLRGNGDAFCGGVDLADHTRDKVSRMLQVFHRIFETMRLVDVIAVAAVDGPALGGGFELAIGCNMVVASESAVFGLPQIKMGLFPPLAAVVLPRAGLRRKAMEWILTGDEIPSSELQQFGIVNRVFPDAEFDNELLRFVKKLTAKSGPVLQLAKRAQLESYYATYEEGLYKVENTYLRDLMSLEDSQEGIEAAREGREPRWRDA
ncbi:MAG: enoyl-CoA hydratase/isomerase family protein [Gemmatimonadetes bacterium]|nr:enoyl-CoA hydratase/isomerase family protein [Gemmatimonadota bacterium]